MGRPVSFDFTTGGGSPEEFLMGVVYLEPTLMHTIGNTVVLPDAPYPVKLVNGKAVHSDVAVSPDGPEPVWAYRVTIKNEITGRAWSELRGVPTGTNQIAYRSLPKFQESPNTPELKPTVEWIVNDYIATEPAVVNAAVEAVGDAIADSQVVTWGTGKNLYDYTKSLVGVYLQETNGQEAALEGYYTSDYIPVDAGQVYSINAARKVILYDSAKNFLSGVNLAAGPYTFTPAVKGWMRFSFPDFYKIPEEVQVEEGPEVTGFEPYVRYVSGVKLAGIENEVQDVLDGQKLVDWTPSKNLYNFTTDAEGFYINNVGQLVAFAGYRTSDFIPVEAGKTYTINMARHSLLLNSGKFAVSYNQDAPGVRTVTPEVDGYLRFSYQDSAANPTDVQVELGSTPTSVVPYGRVISGYTLEGSGGGSSISHPLTVSLTGSLMTIQAALGGSSMTISANLAGGSNQVFNLTGTRVNGVLVHNLNDEPAPIRCQHGTIGANHGFALLAVWEAADHDKTTVDLGSRWSDGSVEYALLALDSSGRAYFGAKYYLDSNGVSRMPGGPLAGNLTHVAGAEHTSTVASGTRIPVGVRQLYPAVQKVTQAVFLDGSPLEQGTTEGHSLEVRESYEILEYASIYDTATSNVGVPFAELEVKGSVRVESVYRFNGGGSASVDVNLTEMTPTALSATGLVQSVRLEYPATRYVPGVKPIAGFDWTEGVDLSTYAVSQKVTTADLHNPLIPPVMSVDVRSDVAFVLGIHPWKPGPTKASERVAEAPTNMWDLRSTGKSYPTVIESEPAGWGRYEGNCVRAYLTPGQAAQVVGGRDAYGAWAALETVVQLP